MVGPLSPSTPLPLHTALKETGTRLNEDPANCGQIATGTSQVCSLQTDARPWGLRTAVSEHRTLESWAGDAEPSPNRQQKGPAKGGLAQQVQHKGHCKSLESSMALKNVPAERRCFRESWENKTPGQAYSSWGLLWTNWHEGIQGVIRLVVLLMLAGKRGEDRQLKPLWPLEAALGPRWRQRWSCLQ